MAMVVEANSKSDGIGGHISTYASAATLYEVGFNHFFRGPNHPDGADIVYFQGHALARDVCAGVRGMAAAAGAIA